MLEVFFYLNRRQLFLANDMLSLNVFLKSVKLQFVQKKNNDFWLLDFVQDETGIAYQFDSLILAIFYRLNTYPGGY